MSKLCIRNYESFEEIRRDITFLSERFKTQVGEIERFNQLFAFAHLALGATINLRGKPSNHPDTLAPLPQRGLQITKIKNNFSSLQELQDMSDMLNQIYTQLKHKFQGVKSADKALAEVEKLKTSITKQLEDSYKKSDTLAKAHVPGPFKAWMTRIKTNLDKRFAKRFDSSDIKLMVVQLNKETHYVGYLHYKNLVDDSNYNYSDYYFIITQIIFNVEKSEDIKRHQRTEYYLTMDTKLKLPGKYNFDKGAQSPDEVMELIDTQLAVHHFITTTEPREIPISDDNIEFNHDAIADTVVKNNKITVTLKKNIKDTAVKEIRDELKKQLIMLVKKAYPKNNDIVRDQIMPKSASEGAQIIFVFSLPHDYKGRALNTIELRKLKDLFSMDDETVKKLAHALDQVSDSNA